MDIVVFSNAAINMITSDLKRPFDGVLKTIISNLNLDKLYTISDFVHEHVNHKQQFVKEVVKTFNTEISKYRRSDYRRGKSSFHP